MSETSSQELGAASESLLMAVYIIIDEWGFFDPSEPRLAHIRWLRPLEAAISTSRIYHFQLEKAAG